MTATDAASATAPATASATFQVTIAPQLVVTPATLSNAVVGTAISSVQLAATGGTPPYQFQSANLPPGLTLAANGALSGTPTAAGTFSFMVNVVDSNGALSSGTEKLTVALPAVPALTIGGLPPTVAPATQQVAQVSLASPFPATVTAILTMTFAPTSGADDPAVQFATGGRTAQIVIPAGATTGLAGVGVQTGTVAGTIKITAQLLAGSVDVTPTPAPSQTIQVTGQFAGNHRRHRGSHRHGIHGIDYGLRQQSRSGQRVVHVLADSGSALQTPQLTTTVTSLFSTYYGGSASAPFGSQFTLTQPFTVADGGASSVLSVTVTLTNAIGTSPAVTANLQ
ncbi:MAG: hypothetical protein WDO73_25965 [Ignavibacteriota bacterium]